MRPFIAFLFLCSTALPVRGQQAPPGSDKPLQVESVNPGDALLITVWRQSELSGEFQVIRDSTLLHPLYKDLKVAGIPLEEVYQRIEDFLRTFEVNPQFVIQPLFRVWIGGDVARSNLYTFPPGTTLRQAVVMAGWAGERANLEEVTLIRDEQEYVADLTKPRSGGQWPVHSGDQILVNRSFSLWRDTVVPVASVMGTVFTIINFTRLIR